MKYLSAISLGLFSLAAASASATPPLVANVSDQPVAESTTHLYILRSVSDNMGLHGPQRSSLFLIKQDLFSGDQTQLIRVQDAVKPFLYEGKYFRSEINSKKDFNIYQYLEGEKAYPIGPQSFDNNIKGHHNITLKTTDNGYKIRRYHNVYSYGDDKIASHYETAYISQEGLISAVNKSIKPSFTAYVGEVPEQHNSEFYALSGAGMPPDADCEIVHISRRDILHNAEAKWEEHQQALDMAHEDHFWIGVSCPKNDDDFSDIHVRVLIPLKLKFKQMNLSSK